MKKFIVNIFKILFCLIVTFDIPYSHFVFSGGNYTAQMKIYILSMIILAVLNWFVLFSKLKIEIKLTVVIITIILSHSINFLPDVKNAFDYDTCFDTNYCAEGIEINTEHGKITVNKENCLKYGYEWDAKRKSCIINTEAESLND